MSGVESPEDSVGVRLLRTPWAWGALACCVLFLAQGLAVLPYPGIQNDEALFASAIYPPRGEISSVRVVGHTVPLMLMTYLGAVKSLLYVPILKVFGPTVYAIRLPMVLAGAATVWLLFLLLNRVAGPAIALFGAAILATDPASLLCTTFDWGPVALQILLFTGAILLLVRHVQEPTRWALPLSALLVGVALWNKAIAVWSLVALMAALLIVFRGRALHLLGPRAAAVAAAALLLGALPLISYNVQNRALTLTANSHLATENYSSKMLALRGTLDGSALVGYLASGDAGTQRGGRPPSTGLVTRLKSTLARTRHSLFPVAIACSTFLLPFVWRSPLRDAALVALLFCVIQYLEMFFTAGAGTSAHHVVLLYPAPHAFVAMCVGHAIRRLRQLANVALAAIGVVLVTSNLLVTTTCAALFSTVGPSLIWSDGIKPLADALTRTAPRQVVVMDWGILASLRLLSSGGLPLLMGTEGLMQDPVSADTDRRLAEWVRTRGWCFVSHTGRNEIFTGTRRRLDAVAAGHGLQPKIDATIADSEGRPVFEVFHFSPAVERVIGDPTGPDDRNAAPRHAPDPPQRGAFYYQPRAAHWWFWDSFDLHEFRKDIGHFRDGNLDTVTFDIQVKDFVEEDGPVPVLRDSNVTKLVSAIGDAERQQLKVLLVLWYTNGNPDAAYSGGARIVERRRFRSYLEMTRRLAAATRGHRVTFFFTNELFDFSAFYDPAGRRWHLKPYPPASAAFASWARAQDPNLGRWNAEWGTSFPTWRSVDVDAGFARRGYWNWLASLIRSRLPELVRTIKGENPLAKVGYEDYTLVYDWGDSAIPRPCPLDFIGFGIYRDMVINNAELAETAYQKLVAAFPGVEVFVPEVGMDTQRYSEAEQAEWFRSVAEWARRRKVSINILMWRDYVPTPKLPSNEQARYGLCRLDGTSKPALRALGEVPRD